MDETLPGLDKSALSVDSLHEEGHEKAYWLAKTPLERLEAVEINRRMVYGINRTTSRLQRLFETSQLTRS